MRRQTDNKIASKISLFGIPIILVTVLISFYLSEYEPEFQKHPYSEIIYSSDRYFESSKKNWHSIDFNSFSIEVPNNYFFFLEEGIHGGMVGGLTNKNDTISFVHGSYYFDACEGVVIGEIIGRCDTLRTIKQGSREIIIALTDSHISAFSKEPNNKVFKAWANLDMDKDLVLKIFRTVELKTN